MQEEEFEYYPHMASSIGSRFIAQILDNMIGNFPATMIIAFFAISGAGISFDVIFWGVIGILVLYHLFNDMIFKGQSVGKKIMNIKTVSVKTGEPCTALQAFLRNFTLLFPGLGLLDMLTVLFTEENRRLGDMIAGTAVMDMPKDLSKYATAPATSSVDSL